MSKIKLTGGTSGFTELQAASVAGNNTITLPANANSLIAADGSGTAQVSAGITAVGIVTSVGGFDGDVTGNITGDVTGDLTGNVTGNATNLSGTPGVDVGLTTVTGLDGVAYVAITTTATSKTIVNREYVTAVGVGTTAGITITLPASPTVGHEVGVAIAGTFTDTVIARNSSKIMALDEDMTLDRAYIAVQFVYVDSTVGWRFF